MNLKTLLFSFFLMTNILQAGEVTNEVRTVIVKMMCDVPNCKGEMEFGRNKMKLSKTSLVLMTDPAQYIHECNVCNAEKTFNIIYPTIRYEEKK